RLGRTTRKAAENGRHDERARCRSKFAHCGSLASLTLSIERKYRPPGREGAPLCGTTSDCNGAAEARNASATRALELFRVAAATICGSQASITYVTRRVPL